MKKNLYKKSLEITRIFFVLALCLSLSGLNTFASSHGEAPLISLDRSADNTDTYAFRSVEAGRSGFVTLVGNWIPLQEPSAGPQFFRFDDTVRYEIKIDNTGDGREDITYRFEFTTQIVNRSTALGHSAVNQDGIISNLTDPDYNMPQTYTVRRIVRTPRDNEIIATGLRTPPNNVGPRVTPNYETNLGLPAVYNLPNGGKVFAGTRDEHFYIDLGIFDALNLRTINVGGPGLFVGNGVDSTQGYNVSTIAIEVPIEALTRNRSVPTGPTDPNAVIGVWATSSRRSMDAIKDDDGGGRRRRDFVQVSRLGSPLVNELVIPLGLKDAFNSISPRQDAVAAPAILDPEFPKIVRLALSAFYGININIPPAPRNDLVAIFATGIPAGAVPGAPTFTTFLSDGIPHEYLRLNTAIPITPIGSQSRLGLLGGDIAGFPNGRRIFDDTVDIVLRAAIGGTPFTPATNVFPNNAAGDGVSANPEGPLLTRFPYLQTPTAGNLPRGRMYGRRRPY